MSTSSDQSELSRPIKIKALKQEPYVIEATDDEREALARRFALSELRELRAEVSLTPKGHDIVAHGQMAAKWLQSCSVSGDDFKASATEEINLRFVPSHTEYLEEEIELEAEQLDEIEFEGDSFDLGEAVAQSLGLVIDPYGHWPASRCSAQRKGHSG